MTYDRLMADIAERVRDWHFCNAHAPTALYLGQAQKNVAMSESDFIQMSLSCFSMSLHFTEDADYVALG